MSTPFKMKGFSGFGNSPMKQNEESMRTVGVIPKAKEYYQKVKDYLQNLKKEKLKIKERNIAKAAKLKYKKK